MPEPRLSTCTMQLKNGRFCEREADLRFPNRICALHAIRVHLAVLDFVRTIDPDQARALMAAGEDPAV